MAQTLFRKSKAEFRICLAPPGTSYRQTINLAHMAHSWPLCGYWTPCPRFPRWTVDNDPNTIHIQVILTHPIYVPSFVSNVHVHCVQCGTISISSGMAHYGPSLSPIPFIPTPSARRGEPLVNGEEMGGQWVCQWRAYGIP